MGKPIKQLRLNSIANVKKTLARVIREYHNEPEPDLARYRTLGYLFNILVSAYRADNEQLLNELEQRVNEQIENPETS